MTLYLALLFPVFLFAGVPVAHSLLMAALWAVVIVGRIPYAVAVERCIRRPRASPCWRSRSSSWPAA